MNNIQLIIKSWRMFELKKSLVELVSIYPFLWGIGRVEVRINKTAREKYKKKRFSRLGSEKRYFPLPNFLLRQLLYSQYVRINIPCLTFPSSDIPIYCLREFHIFHVENEHHGISMIGYVHRVHLINPNPTVVELSKSDYCRAQHFDRHSRSRRRSATI